MAERAAKIHVLVVQNWIHDPTPVRSALASVGLEVAITRADFEAALWAAMSWQRFDAVIFAPTTLSRDAIVECMRAHRSDAALVELGDAATLADRLDAALLSRRS